MGFDKFLYNEKIGTLPKDSAGNPIPALLFANSGNKTKFGDLYLFNNFGIAGSNTITALSEITNNYVESNEQRQDHWAISPITYSLTGYIGEVVYKPANTFTNFLQDKVVNYLEPLEIISPTVSSYVQTAMNTVHQIEANYQKFSKYAENIITSFNNMIGRNQSAMYNSNAHMVFDALVTLRDNRVLVDIYTPYGTYTNMAITNISLTEDDKSKYKWNINVQLQEYKSFETWTRNATEGEIKQFVKSEQLQKQASEEKNIGIANTKNDSMSKQLRDNKIKENLEKRKNRKK